MATQRVLIVHAHPEPKSFTASMKSEAVKTFEELGHEVRVSDLYEINFNPVASKQDFPGFEADYLVYAKEQRAAYSNATLPADIRTQVENVHWADLLVLNFPIYWFSVPAILKGWIDRVFLSGPFYGGMRFYDQGGLRGKKAWITTTLGGRTHMFGDDAVHGRIELLLSHLLRGTLGYVGYDVYAPFFGYHVPYITTEARAVVLDDFKAAIRELENRPFLTMPTLDDFDAHLFPKSAAPAAL